MSAPVVAIVGRPNVGKSTLFNRLIGFKKAVVHDRPGVTRDRLYESTDLEGRPVILMDTGGLEARPDTDLLVAIRQQTLVAIDEADVILFVVDAQKGFTPPDMEVADLLRRSKKPVKLVVNKVDGHRHEDLAAEFWQIGLPELFCVSAEHGRGMYELSEAILKELPAWTPPESEPELDEWDEPNPEAEEPLFRAAGDDPELRGPVRIAVVGRPNIGKSTLINRLLGQERHLVLDMPGTTTDPVDSELVIGDKRYVLVDTAGVRKKARIDDPLERFVSLRAIKSIERCHVTLLVLDGTEGPTDQDARLAQLISERGRAVIVLINKWDLSHDVEDLDVNSAEEALRYRLPHIAWAPHLFISAKTGRGVHRVLPLVDKIWDNFNRRISTSQMNRFLADAVATQAPPQLHNHPVKLFYATQVRVRPPTFAFFANNPEGLPEPYIRYLTGKLREVFEFEGVPLRTQLRKRRKIGET
jgi:GTP-binding protein